jgi:hypothetical protein
MRRIYFLREEIIIFDLYKHLLHSIIIPLTNSDQCFRKDHRSYFYSNLKNLVKGGIAAKRGDETS